MSAASMSTAAAETIEVTIADKEGIIWAERLLRHGTVHRVPREAAERWAGAGRARIRRTFRYVAISAVAVVPYVADRGDVLELPEPAPEYILKTGKLIELKPGEDPPSPLPVDHTDRQWHTLGPMVRVEALAVGPLGGGRADRIGDIIRMRECHAVEAEVYRKARVLDELTAAGSSFRKALTEWRASGATARPDFSEFARPARRAAEKAAALAVQEDAGPMIEARFIGRMPREVAGERRRPNEEFTAPESALAEAFINGRIELLGRQSTRLRNHIQRLEKYRAAVEAAPDDDHKFPVY